MPKVRTENNRVIQLRSSSLRKFLPFRGSLCLIGLASRLLKTIDPYRRSRRSKAAWQHYCQGSFDMVG